MGSELLTTKAPGLWACMSAVEATGISPARTRLSATGVDTCCPVTALGMSRGPRHREHKGDTTHNGQCEPQRNTRASVMSALGPRRGRLRLGLGLGGEWEGQVEGEGGRA